MKIDVKVPDGKDGDWEVDTFTVSEEESRWTRIRAIQHPEEYVPSGTYKRLRHNGSIVMTNTLMEYRSHLPIIHHASGVVLLNGLGLGMVLTAILEKPQVTRVDVVEISPEVLRLVSPTFKGERVHFYCEDAFKFSPNGTRYNAVWHDIWNDICSDNLPAMTRLKRKYGRKCDWQGCWSESMLRGRQ